ncbi:unnamed protein product [Cuscuta campestris]|uniref:Cytokinin riboside 5'-monophosphate phosphoribohydrolase n=1 Tax=Cuscuta campestris TaxID=132261 RepID=A0A484N4E4_9ASTE|nr:unnamed protein product [Cuscuta campestris]
MATVVGLGRELIRRKIKLACGRGSVGLQGAVASTVFTNGGLVRGFILGYIAIRRVYGPTYGVEHTVSSNYYKYFEMNHAVEAFIVLPGGVDTMEDKLEFAKAFPGPGAMMRMVDISQRLRVSEDDQTRGYVEIADLNESLKAAKEQFRQAEEQAQQLAEKAARKARQEGRDQAVAEFISSGAFQEEAFARMNDLLKAWGQTPEGKAFARSEVTSWYNLGLFRAQQVLSDRFLAGEDFPEPCDNPDEFDTSIYYLNGGDTTGKQTNAE